MKAHRIVKIIFCTKSVMASICVSIPTLKLLRKIFNPVSKISCETNPKCCDVDSAGVDGRGGIFHCVTVIVDPPGPLVA